MKIYEYETHFPSKFWVVILDKEDSNAIELVNKFLFYTPDGFMQSKVNTNIIEHFRELGTTEAAETFAVCNRKNLDRGVLVVIYQDPTTVEFAHEAVHVADYYFQYTNQRTEDFSDGNEGYAYLVGWAAGKLSNAVIEYERTKRKTK